MASAGEKLRESNIRDKGLLVWANAMRTPIYDRRRTRVMTPSAWEAYKKTMAQEKPYECPVCDKTFSLKSYLRKHRV